MDQPPQPRLTIGQRARQAGLFILFGTILLIPRIRRLRRRVWAWTCVRLAAVLCGGWLLWRYRHAHTGVLVLAGGFLLLAFGVLVRAKPGTKSMDAMAQEVGALIVLNGGTFRPSPDAAPIPHARIFVNPEQMIVQGPGERRLLEIPLAMVRKMAAHSVTDGSGEGAEPWEVEINWLADAPCTTTFQYDGAFAEHLAQVTESTLRTQWIKDLPVLHQ